VEVYIPSFVISALHGSEWSPLFPGRFAPRGKSPSPRPVTNEQGAGWAPEPIRTPEHPARSVVTIPITLSWLSFIQNKTVYYGAGKNFVASVASTPNRDCHFAVLPFYIIFTSHAKFSMLLVLRFLQLKKLRTADFQ
jgi:hypothetical protein